MCCISDFLLYVYSQLPRGHRVVLLQLLEKVCKEHIHSLGEPLANDLIELASTELTKDPVCFLYNTVEQRDFWKQSLLFVVFPKPCCVCCGAVVLYTFYILCILAF